MQQSMIRKYNELSLSRYRDVLREVHESARTANDLALRLNVRATNLARYELFLRQLAFQKIVIVTGKLHKMKLLSSESVSSLKKKIKGGDIETRWMVIQVVGIKRHRLEPELLDRLDDPDNSVRQAARTVLKRLGRGVDFGPSVAASKLERASAEKQWREWWALQDSNPKKKEAIAKLRP